MEGYEKYFKTFSSKFSILHTNLQNFSLLKFFAHAGNLTFAVFLFLKGNKIVPYFGTLFFDEPLPQDGFIDLPKRLLVAIATFYLVIVIHCYILYLLVYISHISDS